MFMRWEGYVNQEFLLRLFCLDDYFYLDFDIPLFSVSTSTSPNIGHQEPKYWQISLTEIHGRSKNENTSSQTEWNKVDLDLEFQPSSHEFWGQEQVT